MIVVEAMRLVICKSKIVIQYSIELEVKGQFVVQVVHSGAKDTISSDFSL